MKLDISPEVHRALAIQATLNGTTSKALADEILSEAIDSEVWELVRKGERANVPKEKSTFSISKSKSKSPEVRENYIIESNTDQKEIVAKAKKYILAELEKGNEPTVAEVAEHVGMESRPLGVMMKAAGIEAKNTTRKGKGGRRYTLDMIEDFSASL